MIYIVPTRALITQVEDELRSDILKENLDVYLSSVPQKPDDEFSDKSKVLVFTQERLHWFRSESPLFPIDYVIIDEAQKIEDGNRGIILQQKIEDLIRDFPNVRIYFSSPFTSNPEIFINNMPSNKSKGVVSTDFVAVNQNMFFVSKVFREPLNVNIELMLQDEIIPIGRAKLPSRPDNETKRIAFTAASLGGNEGGNIIYASYPSQAETIAWLLYDLFKETKTNENSKLDELSKLVKSAVHDKYILSEVLKRGIAFHYGNMPPIVRLEIEKQFKEGNIKYLVCTSTLLEGVNLPAKSIFVNNPRKGRVLPMSQSDFWNLAGRAGRWGKEFQGNVFCIEPSEWKTNISSSREKQTIIKSLDRFLNINRQEELIKFIENKTPRTQSNEDNELEYAFGYFYVKYISNELIPENDNSIPFFNDLTYWFEKIKPDIEVPDEVIIKNSGISAIAQQNLLLYFKNYQGNIENLIPMLPEDRNAAEYSYKEILMTINFYLSGDSSDEKFCLYLAILIVSWIRGFPLSYIIDKRLEYFKSRNLSVKINTEIRNTMKDVEEFARFKFAKYSTCYIDILRFHLKNIGETELFEKIPDLGIWLELGVSMQTQISLMSLGLNRNSAIEISKSISSDKLTRSEAKIWLEKNYEKIDVSPIMKSEIEKILFGG